MGIDVEIAKRIAENLGVSLEVHDMKFSGLIEAVKRGDVDIVLADMAITPERDASSFFHLVPSRFVGGYCKKGLGF